ncbi:hypothetical protein [Kangiella sp. HZ709]|uniref:hypothetical protein n=1 Tax=Kangiella sp. HZ709 TaxID=2666328 RepID=UPI0012AFA065|nr:hypothetical protein [Kangiella sp. HZ709]MRX28399.1 hypothetical protein [Kangiella sp. HZ709]
MTKFYTSFNHLISAKYPSIKLINVAFITSALFSCLRLIAACILFSGFTQASENSKIPVQLQSSSGTTIEQSLKPKTIDVLWLSSSPKPAEDLILKGFEYGFDKPYLLKFVSLKDQALIPLFLSNNDYEIIIASGDMAWNIIANLNTKTNAIGLGVSQKTLLEYSSGLKANQFLLTKEQPPNRIFAFIDSLELKHAQVSEFFTKHHQALRHSQTNSAKKIGVPYKAIIIEADTSVMKVINSVHNCCGILYLKHYDFLGNTRKHQATFYESYRRRIVTIGNRPYMASLGANYVIYTPEHEIGIQAVNIINKIQQKEPQAAIHYPQEFAIDINTKLTHLFNKGNKALSVGILIDKIKNAEKIFKQETKS